jgi:hypothetical protein
MIVRTQAGGILKPPAIQHNVDATVICTNEGDPILIASSIDGAVCVSTIADSNFAEQMHALGYDKRKLPNISVVNT